MIVLIPDHCLSIYFAMQTSVRKSRRFNLPRKIIVLLCDRVVSKRRVGNNELVFQNATGTNVAEYLC